jgi:hypothetical protein
MLNPFFLNGSETEQGLLQSLINESIGIHGIDVYYIPREYITKRTVIREVIESKFSVALPIEAYVDTYEGYEGVGTLLSKFGIQQINDLTITISKERYENYIAPLIQEIPKIELSARPKEGDLIYFPLGDRLFEIKYVEHENPFYQLKRTYVYTLRCELFRYQDEIIETGLDFIDNNVVDQGFVEIYRMVGIGSTATATATIVNGGVRSVTIINRGDGYTRAPDVGFTTAPAGGLTAVGVATMIGGIVDLCEPDNQLFRVQGVDIVNAGFGYTVPPTVAFYGGGGAGAVGIASIGNGIVGVITVTSQGSGYVEAPSITFTGISSVSAAATAIVQNGRITAIRITNAGLGYTAVPTITISSPYMIGFGTFQFNEEVVGSVTGATARVRKWDATTNTLEVSSASSPFAPGEILIGRTSSATYKVLGNFGNLTNEQLEEEGFETQYFYQNVDIQVEANKILDFSESNPFGNP